MKFAHDFDESLKKEEYPQEWIDSAISYRKLKKCIKKVQRELHGLGLDPHILEHLWQNINNNNGGVATGGGSNELSPRPYSYCISSKTPILAKIDNHKLM
jgi:E3 ubiquitin-protein ligase BAH